MDLGVILESPQGSQSSTRVGGHARALSSRTVAAGSYFPSRGSRDQGLSDEAFAGGSADKESPCNAGDLGLVPELGRFPGEWNGYPLQYSGLENSMDCIAYGATKSQT